MNSPEIFYLNQLRRQIATHEVLQALSSPLAWQNVPICPRCQFEVPQKPRQNQQIFLCVQCRRKFQQHLPIECNCSDPGSIALCQYCPHFQQLLVKVQQRVEELRHLSWAELKQLENQYL